MMIYWSHDLSARASYIRMTNEPPARQQVRGNGSIVLDLDDSGDLVGIEVIGGASSDELAGIAAQFELDAMTRTFLGSLAGFMEAPVQGSTRVLVDA